MAASFKIFVILLFLSAAFAKPTNFVSTNHLEAESMIGDTLANIEEAESPKLFFIIAEPLNKSEKNAAASIDVIPNDEDLKKRSAEEGDDLETAAGTNVLRPLFVYRQQLAYRDRVKKGVARRFGIRPRF